MSREVASVETAPIPFARWSRYCVAGLYFTCTLWGILQVAFPDQGGIYLGLTLCVAVLATSWARYDAKSRGILFLPVLQMLYFCVWPAGAVAYLTYRSGVRGLLVAGIHGMALFFLMVVAAIATFMVLHSAGLLDTRYYSAR